MTQTMIHFVEALLASMTIQHVAQRVSLNWYSVRHIAAERLRRTVARPDFSQVRRLEPDVDGIIAGARSRLSSVVLEGMNNKIKVVKRVVYGYRDAAYFLLENQGCFSQQRAMSPFLGYAARARRAYSSSSRANWCLLQ